MGIYYYKELGVNMAEKNKIKYVYPDSIAEEAGIVPGDSILKVNGKKVKDILEFRFITADSEYELLVEKENGETELITVINEFNEELGIDFEKPLITGARSCANNCIFCFIDQMPPGMRKTLYFKDDDSRLSFLQGNYVTLTNMSDKELDKIIEMRLSPINVSVHCTDPDTRCFMLGNKRAGRVLSQMKKLTDAGINLNAQIVACPGINDGEVLDRTLKDLSCLLPYLQSISVVPVGITKYRDGLYDLECYNKLSAGKIIEQVEKWQEKYLSICGKRIVYASDEFYITAENEFPSIEKYDDFPQLENGVGMASLFEDEFLKAIKIYGKISDRKCTLVTGVIFAGILNNLVKKLGDNFNVIPVVNKFFGEKITVSGLVTGNDLINQLKGIELGEFIVIPESMLRAETEVFLDDVTIADIERELKTKVYVSSDGYSLVEILTGEELC